MKQNDIFNNTKYERSFMLLLNHVSIIGKTPDELNSVNDNFENKHVYALFFLSIDNQ